MDPKKPCTSVDLLRLIESNDAPLVNAWLQHHVLDNQSAKTFQVLSCVLDQSDLLLLFLQAGYVEDLMECAVRHCRKQHFFFLLGRTDFLPCWTRNGVRRMLRLTLRADASEKLHPVFTTAVLRHIAQHQPEVFPGEPEIATLCHSAIVQWICARSVVNMLGVAENLFTQVFRGTRLQWNVMKEEPCGDSVLHLAAKRRLDLASSFDAELALFKFFVDRGVSLSAKNRRNVCPVFLMCERRRGLFLATLLNSFSTVVGLMTVSSVFFWAKGLLTDYSVSDEAVLQRVLGFLDTALQNFSGGSSQTGTVFRQRSFELFEEVLVRGVDVAPSLVARRLRLLYGIQNLGTPSLSALLIACPSVLHLGLLPEFLAGTDASAAVNGLFTFLHKCHAVPVFETKDRLDLQRAKAMFLVDLVVSRQTSGLGCTKCKGYLTALDHCFDLEDSELILLFLQRGGVFSQRQFRNVLQSHTFVQETVLKKIHYCLSKKLKEVLQRFLHSDLFQLVLDYACNMKLVEYKDAVVCFC